MKTIDASATTHAWRVVIADSTGSSREGTIVCHTPAGQLHFRWEIGGGDSVASIHVGTPTQWQEQQPWALPLRAQILQRVAAEAVRQKSPTSHADINDPAGWIDLRAAHAADGTKPAASRAHASVTAPAGAAASHQARRARRARLSMGFATALLVAAAAAAGFKGLFSIRSDTGTPLGPSVRTPQHVATLLSRLEPYVPTLNRNPDDDRHTLSLLLVPVDGRSTDQLVPIAKGWRSRDLNKVRLLGGDGKTVWFNVGGLGGVDVGTRKLIGAADLRRANPGLDEPWNDYRRIEFQQRLRVTSPDRQHVHEVDPASLRAALVPRGVPRLPLTPDLQDFMSVGVHTTPTQWLALLSPQQAAREFRPGTLLSPVNTAESAREMRRLHRAELGPVLDRGLRQVQSLGALSPDEYFNAAFVRGAESGQALRIPAPDSYLMAYNAQPGLGATLVLARVDGNGRLLWRADTGIERFKLSQILPGSPTVAFIGTRPPVPDKVSEPILVLVNSDNGEVSTTSLWK